MSGILAVTDATRLQTVGVMLKFVAANARWLLAGLFLCFFSGFGQTYFISLSNETIRSALGLSHMQFGLAYAISTLASAVCVSQFGYLADRWSSRRAAAVTIFGLALACFAMAFSVYSLFILVISIFGLRLFGQGFCGHVAMTSAGKWFLNNRGKAVSIVGLGFPISEAVMPGIAAFVIAGLGFSVLWAGGAVVLLLIAFPLVALLLRIDRVPDQVAKASDGLDVDVEVVLDWTRKQVSRRPEFYALLLATLCPPFMVTAFFFHQQHLAEITGWSPVVMVSSMLFFAVAQVVSSLVTGWAIDRFKARQILPFYLLPLSLALFIPGFLPSEAMIPVLYSGLGMTAGGAAALLGALWPELFGAKYLGEIRALAYAAMVASTAASPFLTGFLIDLGVSFSHQLAFMGGFSLLASALMGLIQPNLAHLNAKLKPLTAE